MAFQEKLLNAYNKVRTRGDDPARKRRVYWACYTPVSYTHLDVYKRQLLYNTRYITSALYNEQIAETSRESLRWAEANLLL